MHYLTGDTDDKFGGLIFKSDGTKIERPFVSQTNDFPSAKLIKMPVIGTIKAGYDGNAIEELTGETVLITEEDLMGKDPRDFFVLDVSGSSMYPQFLSGDKVLVQKMTSVDSGSIAVILYNNDEATLKKVKYKTGKNWVELIPANPEYQTKRIENDDLEQCRILGRVMQLIRKF